MTTLSAPTSLVLAEPTTTDGDGDDVLYDPADDILPPAKPTSDEPEDPALDLAETG